MIPSLDGCHPSCVARALGVRTVARELTRYVTHRTTTAPKGRGKGRKTSGAHATQPTQAMEDGV